MRFEALLPAQTGEFGSLVCGVLQGPLRQCVACWLSRVVIGQRWGSHSGADFRDAPTSSLRLPGQEYGGA